MKTPIILIPGLQGTKLVDINKNDFKTKWSGIRALYDNLYDIFLRKDGITDKETDIVIERLDVEDLAYKEIINLLKKEGYQVFIFGYDWRKSCEVNAIKLSEFVSIVKTKTSLNKPNKVSFITHSNGAMVLSSYLKNIETSAKINSIIDRIIFTAPPFLGSVEAIFNLVIGKSRFINTSDDFRKLARTLPAVFELCPVYDGAAIRSDNKKFDLTNLTHWQANLQGDEIMKERLKNLKKVRASNNLIFDIGTLSEELRKRILVIAGVGENSQYSFGINNANGNLFTFPESPLDKPENEGGGGDGTVHLVSARVFEDSVCTLTVNSNWFETRLDSRVINYNWHSFMLNNGRVQSVIERFLLSPTSKSWYNTIDDGVRKIGNG